jgi:hypothetical protein
MSYEAGTWELKARQGSTYTETLTVTNTINGVKTPLDLTGYTARMMVRTHPSSTDVVLTLTTENGKISIIGSSGTITLNVSATEMDAVTARSYRYDLEIVNGSTVIPLLEGAFTVKPQVTK